MLEPPVIAGAARNPAGRRAVFRSDDERDDGMNRKAATLGLGGAAIAALVAFVAAARGRPKAVDSASNRDEDVSRTATKAPADHASAANGPTGHAPAPTGAEGHAAPDLAAGSGLSPDTRAPAAFRPDMDAPMTPAEREALRPATGPSPSLVADRGDSV